jgi:hypothetical protein
LNETLSLKVPLLGWRGGDYPLAYSACLPNHVGRKCKNRVLKHSPNETKPHRSRGRNQRIAAILSQSLRVLVVGFAVFSADAVVTAQGPVIHKVGIHKVGIHKVGIHKVGIHKVGLSAIGIQSSGIQTPEMFDPAGPAAESIRSLFGLVLAISAVIFVAVGGTLLVFVLRFRERIDDGETEPPQLYGSQSIELAWTLAPLLTVLPLSLVVIRSVVELRARPPVADDHRVRVVGHQWWW